MIYLFCAPMTLLPPETISPADVYGKESLEVEKGIWDFWADFLFGLDVGRTYSSE